MSYTKQWPLRIAFLCLQPATQGGETPICNSQKVFQRIPRQIREVFQNKKIMYVRNYGKGLDLSWQQAFQTTDKSEIEVYCQQADIEVEWLDHDRLRTREVCQAVVRHPRTSEILWFNQAHLFHTSSLPPIVRTALLNMYAEEDLPRQVYYGDGTSIADEVLDQIRACYQQETIPIHWQQGDILFLDNMLIAHGRASFSGPRKVIVGMTQLFKSQHDQTGE
jgi:alpha-ketoglutarate-dependent taurine dioxygenase